MIHRDTPCPFNKFIFKIVPDLVNKISLIHSRGFEEGSVETGEVANEWVLTHIVKNN